MSEKETETGAESRRPRERDYCAIFRATQNVHLHWGHFDHLANLLPSKGAHTNRTGENPNPWNSENQTLLFFHLLHFSLSNDRTAERKKNSNTQQQQNCRKERKTRTHQRHWLSTQRYNSIIIAFRVRLLHDLCLSLSSHMETNQATECNIHSDTNTHTKYTSKIARLQVIEEMCDCSFANAHAHTKWWWHAVKPKTESGDT